MTAERFTVGRTSYQVGDLTHLRTTRGPHDRVAVRAVVITTSMLGGVGLLLGFSGGLQHLTAGAYLILGAVFLLPAALALVGDRWRPPPYELWGWYQGAEVLLFSADDERQFGQVTRRCCGPGGRPLRQLGRPARLGRSVAAQPLTRSGVDRRRVAVGPRPLSERPAPESVPPAVRRARH
ncbi:DUF6232 family protein [Micromonospora sp. M12]